MVDASCLRFTAPKSWSVFSSRTMLSTSRKTRMCVQFNHNTFPPSSLAEWMNLVPDQTMRCPNLRGRDSWMRFHFRSYQTLPWTPDGRIFGEITPYQIGGNNPCGYTAYIRYCDAPSVVYHPFYDDESVSLEHTSQLIPVNLVRLDSSETPEHFVFAGRQSIPLS